MGLRMLSSEVPAGFRTLGSGIAVPAESSRIREVLTGTEWKTIDRAAKILKLHAINLTLSCGHADCAGKIEQVAGVDEPTLQCDCRTRVFRRDL